MHQNRIKYNRDSGVWHLQKVTCIKRINASPSWKNYKHADTHFPHVQAHMLPVNSIYSNNKKERVFYIIIKKSERTAKSTPSTWADNARHLLEYCLSSGTVGMYQPTVSPYALNRLPRQDDIVHLRNKGLLEFCWAQTSRFEKQGITGLVGGTRC